jgi:hypothetical protein
MDKKQKLRLRTPESSSFVPRETGTVDFTRDSSIIIPSKITMEASSEQHTQMHVNNDDSLDFLQYEDFKDKKENEVDWKGIACTNIKTSISYAKKYWIYVLVLILTYFNMKPTDYQLFIDEIEKLKKENIALQAIQKVENIADISFGTSVSDCSEMYKYGFFRSSKSDPNSIIEAGNCCLALSGQAGFFEIKLKFKNHVNKIGLYHPEVGNFESSIKDFTVITNDKELHFSYGGKGYEEFLLENVFTDIIKIKYSSNHGEGKYTCIYRIFIFA